MYASSQSSQTTSDSEITPLVATSPSNNETKPKASTGSGNFYFLNRDNESFTTQQSVSRETAEVEKLPYGATENEFASRPVMVSFLARFGFKTIA